MSVGDMKRAMPRRHCDMSQHQAMFACGVFEIKAEKGLFNEDLAWQAAYVCSLNYVRSSGRLRATQLSL